jgi:hypothetical protein
MVFLCLHSNPDTSLRELGGSESTAAKRCPLGCRNIARKDAKKCRPFFMKKIIFPVASEEGGEAVVPIVEEGDKIIVVVGPGTRLLHRPISNVNALEILK